MKILVTGGAGFIGSNLVKQLIEDGVDHVAVIDDFSTGLKENLRGLAIELFEGSILDRELLSIAARDSYAIVHLAARPSVPLSIQDPVRTHHVNATGTLHVLEEARKYDSHVSLASSSSVYGGNPTLPKSEFLRTIPVSPYGVSKLATESYAIAYNAVYGTPVLPFRFFNVYGPGQTAEHAYAAVIPTFIDAALKGHPLPIQGDGHQTRDFTYIDTVTQIISTAARKRVNVNDVVNLAFGTSSSLLDVVDTLEEIFGKKVQLQFDEPRIGDIRDSQADCVQLRTIFPEVQSVALKPGLTKTVNWFKSL